MDQIGISRRLDELGRVVIPLDLRRTLGMQEGDVLELSVTGDSIVLRLAETKDEGHG